MPILTGKVLCIYPRVEYIMPVSHKLGVQRHCRSFSRLTMNFRTSEEHHAKGWHAPVPCKGTFIPETREGRALQPEKANVRKASANSLHETSLL